MPMAMPMVTVSVMVVQTESETVRQWHQQQL